MAQSVRRSDTGMTLIEVMIAMMIMMIVSLALMRTALVGMQVNMENSLRDEASSVIDQNMNGFLNTPFDSLVSQTTTTTVVRSIRRTQVTYTVTNTVTNLGVENKQISVSAAWTYKGRPQTYNVTTIMRKQ